MAMHKQITESEATRIWYLHKKGLRPHDVAVAIERSVQSVHRVIDIFTKTDNAQFDELERLYGKTHQKLLLIARAHFNVEQPKMNENNNVTPVRDNTAKYLGEVLAELRRNNELLQKLASAWGVEM